MVAMLALAAIGAFVVAIGLVWRESSNLWTAIEKMKKAILLCPDEVDVQNIIDARVRKRQEYSSKPQIQQTPDNAKNSSASSVLEPKVDALAEQRPPSDPAPTNAHKHASSSPKVSTPLSPVKETDPQQEAEAEPEVQPAETAAVAEPTASEKAQDDEVVGVSGLEFERDAKRMRPSDERNVAEPSPEPATAAAEEPPSTDAAGGDVEVVVGEEPAAEPVADSSQGTDGDANVSAVSSGDGPELKAEESMGSSPRKSVRRSSRGRKPKRFDAE